MKDYKTTTKSNFQDVDKALGKNATRLFLELLKNGHHTFSLADAEEIVGLQDFSLRNFVSKLQQKGFVSRIKAGLYNIVPLEMGTESEYLGDPYIVVREIVRKKFKKLEPQYFISHASAMDIHQMVTQPHLEIYATTTQQIKAHHILGTKFHFITCKPQHYFGFKKHWATKSEMVFVSDLERTVLDGLKMPEYCGGITEVAKGFWMKRSEINYSKLVDYAEKLNIGAVYRRLGYLLEVYKIDCPKEIERLQKKITRSYSLLDPTLLEEGKHQTRWQLQLNIREEEFLSVVRT